MGGMGAGLDPGGGSRGASLGGLGIRAMSSFPFSRVGIGLSFAAGLAHGSTPNLQPDRARFADRAIASHSDATNNIVRRASRSFMPSALARASAALRS